MVDIKKVSSIEASQEAFISNNHPELILEKNFASLMPQSVLGSQAATVNEIGVMYANSDRNKHLWSHAGYCRIKTGRPNNDWQHYYVFIYEFSGIVPQTVMIHKYDRFLLPVSPDNKILTDTCPPWHVVVAEQYEIESLTILTRDIASRLADHAKNNHTCTIEFFESKLLCFLPVEKTSSAKLLMYEIAADTFARLLLPKLEGAYLNLVGNIPPVLAFHVESEEENIKLSKSEKGRQKLTLFITALFILTFMGTLIVSNSDTSPLNFLSILIIIYSISIWFMMPKRSREQWLRASGIRINGRRVNVRRKNKSID